jgi:mono/diheme cytochrome c family protein
MKWFPTAPGMFTLAILAYGSWTAGSVFAADTSAALELRRWSTQAGAAGSAEKGRVFFTTKQGGQWSCSSCHGAPPSGQGKHANTGKSIAPLAPAFNPQGFTEQAKVDKWFRRNCNDVLSRECSASEKADVLAYLLTVQP